MQGKQFWRAENDYRLVIEGKQNHLVALCGLADVYCDLGLWVLLQDFLQSLEKQYSETEEVKVYQKRLKHKIAEIFSEIKENWLEGKKEETRRSLMKYLKLVPDDREILALCDVICTLDEEDALLLVEESKKRENNKLSNMQLLQKAQNCLNVSDAEPAIGILEGLSRKESDKSAFYREKIGDIRLHQKDLCSARWHFKDVFTTDLILPKLKEKIAQLRL